jgi:entry exclusion lipoprotein TrbK
MNQSQLLTLLLLGLLSGCNQPCKPVTELNCKDSPVGRPKVEQIAIADACFRQGRFKKSSGREW